VWLIAVQQLCDSARLPAAAVLAHVLPGVRQDRRQGRQVPALPGSCQRQGRSLRVLMNCLPACLLGHSSIISVICSLTVRLLFAAGSTL